MNKEIYAVPTRKARFIGRILLVSSLLSLLLILPFSHWYVHMLNDIQDIDQTRRILIASSLLPTVLFASLTSWLMALGHRTILLKHWPPEGLPILYRTTIHTGRMAMTNGVICLFASGFTGVIAIFWFYMTWKSWNL